MNDWRELGRRKGALNAWMKDYEVGGIRWRGVVTKFQEREGYRATCEFDGGGQVLLRWASTKTAAMRACDRYADMRRELGGQPVARRSVPVRA